MYDVTATFSEEQAKLDGTHPIELYCLNASLPDTGWNPLYYANINQDIIGFSLNSSGDMVATEVTYTGFEIKSGSLKSEILREKHRE